MPGRDDLDEPRPDRRDRTVEFLAMYEPVAPAIFAWARLHVHPPLRRRVDPEDVLQEVSFRAFDRFDRFDPDVASFRSWLFGIAHNVLRESLRNLRGRGESVFGPARGSQIAGFDGFAAEATNVSTRIAREEGFVQFLERLEDLPDEDRRLLIYRGLEGRPHQEVADRLGIGSDAAEKRWQRLRKRLQESGLPAGLLAS
ncbi:MAG: sigma-70 family RNA polymerase sigma factor [Planctomycetes bacterium]|nr:sigma-70 family RNA polymerase sigma factor [Planctomycetota bacterium]